MKRVLVLCSGYPTADNPYNCTWAHTRNKYYLSNGYDVDVMVMDSNNHYEIDGVKIIKHNDVINNLEKKQYSLIISHSPNIRKHIPFLSKINRLPIVLFMHGSESMYINKDYPQPYGYMEDNFFKALIRSLYDNLKFIVLKKFIINRKEQVRLVFVSQWMKDTFERNVFNTKKYNVKCEVINNSLSSWALERSHKLNSNLKKADFVTLRRLDASKFGIDLVVAHALANPNYTYHIYGRGNYFSHNTLPHNITLFDKHIESQKIPDLLDYYECAMMPTRCDAQGVMVCEMATYGMPVITTNIDVNYEMFSDFKNVKLLPEIDFSKKVDIDFSVKSVGNKTRFSFDSTLHRELQFLVDLGLEK